MNKVFQLEGVKIYDTEDDERKFSGYASTFGNLDRVGDIVDSGAFEKSLNLHKSDGTMPAMLLHHDLKRPIGRWTAMTEDAKGLSVEGILTKGVQDADEAYALLKSGAISSMSIGYRVKDEDYDAKAKANHLKEIELHEVSLVTIPANQSAMVSAVKDADGELNIRELEIVLRDAGLSRKEAKTVLAAGAKALVADESTEVVEEVKSERDADLEARQLRLRALLEKLNNIKS